MVTPLRGHSPHNVGSMSLIIPTSEERRRNLIFSFAFLPSFLALAAYEAIHAEWSLALAALALWMGVFLFSVSHIAQAAVTLAIAIGTLATRQWVVAIIAFFATFYLLFTTFALKKVPHKQLSDRLPSLPWLLRPLPILAKTPDWKAALIGFILGLLVLGAALALAGVAAQ